MIVAAACPQPASAQDYGASPQQAAGALNRFYNNRTQEVIASWMTRQDREQAIADNIEYVRSIIETLHPFDRLVLLGFSQGAAMAFRTAATVNCDGVIAMGGDVPPDVTQLSAPVLLARGERDEWYTQEKFEKDLSFLRQHVSVTSCVFNGGHEFTDEFRETAAAFLRSL